MKRPLLLLVPLLFAAPCLAQEPIGSPVEPKAEAPAEEDTNGLTWGIETDLNSRYVFRGVLFSEGAVLQSSAWVTKGYWTFNIWTNYPFEKGADKGKVNEIDYTLYYNREWKRMDLEAFFVYYYYPDFTDTGELSVKLSWPAGTGSLFLANTVDVIDFEGAYFAEVGWSKELELNPKLSFEAGISTGWGNAKHNDAYVGVGDSGLLVAGAQIAWTYTGSNGIYVRPHFGFTRLIERRFRRAVEKPDVFTAGIAVGKEF